MVRLVALCGVLVTGLAGVARGAPVVQPGANYVGRSSDRTYAVQFVVGRDGRSIRKYDFGFRHGRCSDGGPYASFWFGHPRGRLIDAQGNFSFHDRFTRAFNFTRSGRRVNGRERVGFRLHFERDRLDGVIFDVFRSRRLNCASGPVLFVAYRAGSPSAPFRTASVATGRYVGRSRLVRSLVLDVELPLRWIARARLSFRLPFCTRGLSLRLTDKSLLYDIPIDGDRFIGIVRGSNRDRDGFFYRTRGQLSGSFAGGARYTATVRVRWAVSVYRGGRFLGRCFPSPAGVTTLTVRWVGR